MAGPVDTPRETLHIRASPTLAEWDLLNQQRGLLVVDSSFDRVRNGQAFVQGLKTLLAQLSPDEQAAMILGTYVEQVAYNSAVQQQANLDGSFRSFIGQDTALDDTLPRLASMRQRLAALPAGDWKNVQKQSLAIVNYILKAK